MVIYRLETDVDNYCSLLVADSKLAASKLMAFDGSSQAAQWPLMLMALIDNVDAPTPDVLDIGAGNLVLHGRTRELLEPRLADYCEFLPVHWPGDNGDVVNVVGLSDCLDSEASKWVLGKESGKRIRIEKFVFCESKVPPRLIFKIPERRFELFCIDQFKSLVELHQITGVNFVPVWVSNSDCEAQASIAV